MAQHPEKRKRFDRLRQQAEELLRQNREQKNPDLSDSMLDIIYELQVHQTELEIQNEELMRAHHEISELQRTYEELYQSAPCGYLTLTSEGIISRANARAVEILVVADSHVGAYAFSSYLRQGWESAYLDVRQRAADTGRPQSVELPLGHRADPSPWVQAEITADLEEDGSVCRWRLVIVDISDRKATEITLAEKEALLKEVHHRVKNNMQVISSLISMQAGKLPDGEARGVLDDLRQRVQTMALIHEKLYQTKQLNRVRFDEYCRTLTAYLLRANRAEAAVEVEFDLEPVELPVTLALPGALILNEAFCNAQQHAFQGRRKGRIRIGLEHIDMHRVRLRIEDDGVGLPTGLDWQNTETLGLQLITILSRQIEATVEIDSTSKGTALVITFTAGT